MKFRLVGNAWGCLLLATVSSSAQFSITPMSTFGTGGWLAPNGYNGSTYTYLTSGDTERGLAYGNHHLYLVSRNGGNFIRILDSQTGADLGALNQGTGIVAGGTFAVSLITTAADGSIYLANLAIGPTAFRVYRWSNDLASTMPTVVYNDVPLAGARIGDSLAAIGSGTTTLLAAGFNNNPGVTGNNGYAIVNPNSGTATAVRFDAGVAAGDFRLGISFVDSNHVIGTQGGGGTSLRYTSFSGTTGDLLASPSLNATDERPVSFAVVGGLPLLAALSTSDNHVSVYDMTDPTTPILLGQANATTGALPADPHNTGAIAWGEINGTSATLYAMATADGIQAFQVTVPGPAKPSITDQPKNLSVVELTSATLTVTASGNPAPTYQWFRNGALLSGANYTAYTIPSVRLSDKGAQFFAVAQNTINDVVYSATSSVATLTVTPDLIQPTAIRFIPAPGSTVHQLGQIEVHFSEAVTNVTAHDLLINGVPTTNVTAFAPNVYVFDFPQPALGTVEIKWNVTQAIIDLASNANHFSGRDAYNYTLNPSALANSVLITEFMAENNQIIRDSDGHYSDWIELYNSSENAINLGGWYLTDDSTQLRKWEFPTGFILGSKTYALIWASGLNRTNLASALHTNFKLAKSAGGFLGLIYADGITVVSAFWNYPSQYADVSYGRDRLDPSFVGYFNKPTPGVPNSTLGPGFGPQVQFSAASGTFTQPFDLALTLSDTNAVIRYVLVTNAVTALAGNVPTANSPIYTGPLRITNTVQVRARAFSTQPGFLPGPVHNETFLQIASDATSVNSDLPIVVFHNMGAGSDVPATDDQFITMQVFDVRNGRSSLLNPPDLAAQGYFHRRGQATFWDPKPNLRVETQNEYGDNLDVELLGMPAENDWVFYGIDTFDKVLMHNPLSHELYREMGHYSSHTRYVEVYIKLGSGTPGPITRADYYGLYVIEEKVKIGKNRVDIDKLLPENTNSTSITGGYLLSIDKSNPGSPANIAGLSMWYIDPDYYALTQPQRAAQKQYIDNYFNQFYSALTGPNWRDPMKGYAAYIDVPSWIDYHLHQTFVFNVDMLRISSYFYKPRNGKIVQGPIWDFDRAFADSSDDRGFNPRQWRSLSGDGGTDVFNPNCSIFCNPWYGKLFTDPDFWQQWIDRYQELRQTVYSYSNLVSHIDRFGNEVRKATAREYARWSGSGSSDTSPRSGYHQGDGFAHTFPNPGTWQGEIDFTKNWFSNRLDFMDVQFLNPPALSRSGGVITSGLTLTITASTREANSTIYYTLDGSDPRLPGGGVSPRALSSLNRATVTLTNNARLFARNWNLNHHNLTGANNPPLDSPWSGASIATYVVETPLLAVTEIMYHPQPSAPGTNDAEQFEFLELKNVGTRPLDLRGIHFTQGLQFGFNSDSAMTNLGPGQYLVLVRNLESFKNRYPEVTNIAGQYSNQLNNAGERLRLEGALQEVIFDFSYESAWYPVTDGAGFSLVSRNENTFANAWSNPANWRASTGLGGSPGRADAVPDAHPPILVNEAMPYAGGSGKDSIELYNPSAAPADIGGWFLTDNPNQPQKYRIPNNTIIPALGFLVFTEDKFGKNGSNSFGLNRLGDAVYLFSGDGTNVTGYRHGFAYGAQVQDATFGRYLTSDGQEHFVTQSQSTLGASNVRPKVGPIVLNEIMYAPPPFGVDPDPVDEYIELRNISGQPVALFDLNHATNSWKLDGAVQFLLPSGIVMPPWSFLLLVSFDPEHDPAALSWFRNRYGLDASVAILGPYQGHLSNEGENLRLLKPDEPEPVASTNPGFVPYVLVEEVHYSHLPPWPAGAYGTGQSLARIASAAFGDDPANWQADLPSPGKSNAGGLLADSDGDGIPDEQEFIAGTDPLNRQDFLQFTRITTSLQTSQLQFNTRVGHTYAIERSIDFGNNNPWSVVQDHILGTDGVITVTDSRTETSQFYRLRVARD